MKTSRSRRCCMTWSRTAEACRGLREIRVSSGRGWLEWWKVARIRSASRRRSGSERKKDYLGHVKHAESETRLVSAADKLHNVRTILADYRRDGESIWRRFSGKREGTLWYYRALSDEFRRRGANRITRELEIAVRELEQATGVKPESAAGKKRARRIGR